MKSYQKAQKQVKESVKILDEEALLETAAEGLLSLSVEIGMKVVHQILEADVTALAVEKGGITVTARHIGMGAGRPKSSWAAKNERSGAQGCVARDGVQ